MANANASMVMNQGDTTLTSSDGTPPAGTDQTPTGAFSLLTRMDTMRQVGMMLALAVCLALAVLLMLWAQEPEYRPLGAMETEELVETLDFLDQQQIPYQISGNVVSVPAESFSDIRLTLTRNGLGSARPEQDFLTQESGFGVSQRMEQARLKHSQEQALARAVEELRRVKRARVILALPQQNVFARRQRQPSATVVVTLANGSELRQSEVDAVVDIVASAVHGLSPAKVTVTDQHGRLLNSGSQDGVSAQSRRELELQTRQEQLYLQKVDSILMPVLGLGNYTAQVDVTMDFSAVEETTRRFDPDAALRSEMVVQDRQSDSLSGGIPGALTNQPPAASVIPEQAGQGNGLAQESTTNGRSRSEATRNYELDSTISHTRQQVGTIRRVTLSVAVDYANTADGAVPRGQQELDSLRRLLQGSVGFDAGRGDVLEVVSIPFANVTEMPLAEVPLHEQPWFWRVLKLVLGALGILLLVLVFVRPMTRRLMGQDSPASEALPAPGDSALSESSLESTPFSLLDGTDTDYGYADDGSIVLPDLRKDDDMLRAVRALVANEPDLSTQVINSWLNDEE